MPRTIMTIAKDITPEKATTEAVDAGYEVISVSQETAVTHGPFYNTMLVMQQKRDSQAKVAAGTPLSTEEQRTCQQHRPRGWADRPSAATKGDNSVQ